MPGLIEAWYPGQEGGSALAEILFGETSPSGHLPATFERQWEDNPVHDSYYTEPGTNRTYIKKEYSSGTGATNSATSSRSFRLDLAFPTPPSSIRTCG